MVTQKLASLCLKNKQNSNTSRLLRFPAFAGLTGEDMKHLSLENYERERERESVSVSVSVCFDVVS